ncbi:hypothetical protein B4092_2675 [Bacillus licheniformis]|nr:hypothetical protein B4092_2675 [Bacillus licheniformis]KYC75994.1 hypothetical protein B4090_2680 [Bacillus licheniformis]KYC81285.1 hypothetical protein B4091_3305 [Bacillus licheniformis]KYC97721.1 hypothetical protein B4164_2460 [Bacillus licheniformis]OLF92893.1 hypothetical protein B4089_1865 [Bacillus licheniformis]
MKAEAAHVAGSLGCPMKNRTLLGAFRFFCVVIYGLLRLSE